MTFFKELLSLLKSLTYVDVIFFVAMIALLVLIVTLIYFIKINKEDEGKTTIDDNNKVDLSDIIPISLEDIGAINDDEATGEMIDLESVTKALEERKTHPIEMTDYEQEQEERAIISYDELLAKNSNLQVNYETSEKEENKDISIKKVDLGNLVSKVDEEPPKTIEVRLISYEKEEAFLEALKRLQEQIN